MEPTPPFWFKLRQAKMEATGPDIYRVFGPNLAEAWVGTEAVAPGQWRPIFRKTLDGPNLAGPDVILATQQEAYEAAFELYRVEMVT